MTIHYIDYRDATYLGFHMVYLQQLPQRIEAFKIKLDLVPASEYGRYREPALDAVVKRASSGSGVWSYTADALRTLHQETRHSLVALIEHIDSDAPARTLKSSIPNLQDHAAQFSRQQKECGRLVEDASTVIPRFIDFMNQKIFEYAQRHQLLIGASQSNVPKTFRYQLVPDRNLTSALVTVGWNARSYATALLTSSNVAVYCGRLNLLLDTVTQSLEALDERQSTRRLRVSKQLASVPAREALRLISHTFETILRFRF